MVKFFKGKEEEEEFEGDWKKIFLNMNFLMIDCMKLKGFLKCFKWI